MNKAIYFKIYIENISKDKVDQLRGERRAWIEYIMYINFSYILYGLINTALYIYIMYNSCKINI